jgi:hypothetical protein
MSKLTLILLCLAHEISASLPVSYANVLSSTLSVKGGARLEPEAQAWFTLEQILKRVAAQDPALDLNITKIREASDDEILRLLTLAAIGNFTSNKANSLLQPFKVAIDQSGKLIIEQENDSGLAVEAMLIILCVILFKKWYDEDYKA